MSRVKGLQNFSDFFRGYENDYVIIGGAAIDIILQENDLSFRVTKDVDIVILTNSSEQFNGRILEYVQVGGYEAKETIHGKQYYRFSRPKDVSFPEIIELFARNEAQLKLGDRQHIIPIKNDEADKLSAILLDNEYFDLIKNNCIKSDMGFSIINPLGIICLKARAFRELTERKTFGGKNVDAKDIKKHRNDILRLAQVLNSGDRVGLGPQASLDLRMVIDEIKSNLDAKIIKQILESSKITKDSLIDAIENSFEFLSK